MSELVTKEEVLDAYRSLRQDLPQTPLQYDSYLSEKYQARIYLKREDLQVVRSFKIRGAYYAINQLSDEDLAKGVICASAGNHAQGVAYTAQKKGIQAVIFMPNTTPNQKISQVQYFGGDFVDIQIEGDTFDESNRAAHAYAKEHGLSFIEPYDDLDVMRGQGTLAVEVHQDLVAEGQQADYFLVQVGGGGLISGVSAYVKDAMPETKVIGVEPTGAASMKAALDAGAPTALERVDKFCDGTAVGEAGQLTFQHVKANVDDICLVPEGLAAQAILELYTKQAIVAEPSGALSVAALELLADQIKGKTVVCLISGGNNDINRMAEIEEKALIYEGIKHYFIVNFPQRAGALREFVTDVLGPGDDISVFEYTKRKSHSSGPVLIGIDLAEAGSIHGLKDRMAAFDPNYIDISENSTLYQFLV
ncbi:MULTISPECIES: threonine ammonia-lyase IlvA [Aerococcus]|uniref:L-threonine dehydratase n=1 Tax=Aerococcus sanguinicola TaxID=119206 RepID=A0A5N1GJE7_9LACT|nr:MULTISPECIES: threonine ammonia-lyase IlvA [Aerococcus]KAA9300466.1 threonine ammonia-lyase IlvA [Aerococcus sanguinicola]MDK6369721.1 threonine ammonia-lyase IlvA [Aerococcus sp. UMB9870]MDK6680361.1 threonine ammonia-lyase IlvA [Aerococcus sp. UMB8608]MDK6686940.1 threonine ammonia-lyase IlvA [Aerococcus sp. UMB8623]MDK6940052.1 threonine ammonia-lyase IlvA [Aerococcus sp. UMB8487]